MLQSLDNLNFHELNQASGLSELQNPYLFQDSRGFLWIGSYDGLNRFDGKTNKVFRPVGANGKRDSYISGKVFEDNTGTLWFSTYSGIYRFLPNTEKIVQCPLPTMGNKHADDYYAFHLDGRQRLWLIADDSLRLLNVHTGKDSVLHALDTYICQALEDTQSRVIALAVPKSDGRYGIDIITYENNNGFNRKTYFTEKDPLNLPPARISFLKTEGDSILWLPSDIGLIRFPWKHPQQYRLFSYKKQNKNVVFWDVAFWHNDPLVTSFGGGLTQFRQTDDFVFNKTIAKRGRQEIDFSKLNNILITPQGNIWISSWGKGVYYANLQQTKFFSFITSSIKSADPAHPVTDLAITQDNKLYYSLPDKGLFILDKDLHIYHHLRKVLPKNARIPKGGMNRIFIDREGDVWAQVGRDLYISKNGLNNFKWIGKNLDAQSEIIQVNEARFFIMTLTHIYEISKPRSSILDFEQLKPLTTVGRTFKFYWDQNKTLFVSDGFDRIIVYEILDEGLKMIKEIDGVGFINGVVPDNASKSFWLASSKGLINIDQENLKENLIKGKPNFLSHSFNAILPDNSGNLWLSSNNGIFKYSPATGAIKHYTESDGLQGLQFMPGSACRLSDGRLAFGGVNGMNIFHPDSVRDNPNPPIVHFTDWIVNDTGSISSSPEYLPRQSFNYENRTFSFHFVGIDYTAPDEVQYRYRLAGFETDTVEGGTNGFARYAQLPAGDYSFQVWAANSDGVWTVEPHELHFTVLPPWYATWWARTIQALLAAGLLYGFYRNRIAQVRRKETERRKEAEFRQKEAESKQLAAELQNSVLRLQMNPHFIFNSMNSISSYILRKDIDTANDYLSRFARLMRAILNLASKPLIPIVDEIDLLEQYIQAESMRLEQKFTWEIQVDEVLDPDETLIPTMILQPFVENAIWHGLSPKKSPGHIKIGFSSQDKLLVCTVEDNGVGRTYINTHPTNSEHASKAVEITQQRLELLGKNADLNIVDVYDNKGLPGGTRVIIQLPADL